MAYFIRIFMLVAIPFVVTGLSVAPACCPAPP